MRKQISKFLAVAVLSASLAVFWHAATMDQSMKDSDGMSASCLTSCLAGGNLDAFVVENGLTILQAVALAMMLFLFFPAGSFIKKENNFDYFKKDRHRYLMKTMVMLR